MKLKNVSIIMIVCLMVSVFSSCANKKIKVIDYTGRRVEIDLQGKDSHLKSCNKDEIGLKLFKMQIRDSFDISYAFEGLPSAVDENSEIRQILGSSVLGSLFNEDIEEAYKQKPHYVYSITLKLRYGNYLSEDFTLKIGDEVYSVHDIVDQYKGKKFYFDYFPSGFLTPPTWDDLKKPSVINDFKDLGEHFVERESYTYAIQDATGIIYS